MMSDEKFMRLALDLAARGRPSPNPHVGCVIVKDGRVVARGYHKKAGMPHAEIEALHNAKNAKNSTLYVNLEPCCHYGRTPPCTKAIIGSGIRRVVVGMWDPNPIVNGRGIRELRKAGIRVKVGVLESESRKINEFYVRYIKTKTPFVILKSAMSLDGRITSSSRWITNAKSRRYVHELRDRVDAILVGINTVLKDDPRLTCRIRGGRNPLRIVVDSRLRIPPGAKVLKDKNVIVVTTKKHDRENKLAKRGVMILNVRGRDKVDLKSLMKELGRMGITSVMIEGGREINTSALNSGIVDKVMLFIAPRITGNSGLEFAGKTGELRLIDVRISNFDDDILVEGYVN